MFTTTTAKMKELWTSNDGLTSGRSWSPSRGYRLANGSVVVVHYGHRQMAEQMIAQGQAEWHSNETLDELVVRLGLAEECKDHVCANRVWWRRCGVEGAYNHDHHR